MLASVLIVDDQEIGRITLQGLLLPLGYELHFAASGKETLDMLIELRPDVILLDVMMPEMDGFEVCRYIRSDARWRDIPVILVTALDDRKSRIEGLESGADDFISKPVDWAELRARVRTTVELGQTRRQLQTRARFEWAVAQSSDGFICLDEESRIMGANSVAQSWLGIDASPGCFLLEKIKEKFVLQPETTWADIAEVDAEVTVTLVRPETEHSMSQWLQLILRSIPATETEPGTWMAHLQDVTALQARIQQTVTVLAFLSHKLNSPLASLSAALEMIALRTDGDELLLSPLHTAFESVANLESEIAQLLHLVEEFRENVYDMTTTHTEINLDEAVERVCQQSGLYHDQYRYTRTLTRYLPFRPTVVEQILRLLLENAIKFHPEGTPQIAIVIRDEGSDSIRIEVEDDGPGIPPEFRERAWQPLYQVDRVGAGTVAGTGIGLSLVANVVWRIGGRCWIESGDDGGTRICIVAPTQKAQSS